jgi:hypothetical protein
MPWELASPFGIEISAADVWHSGRVNALLTLASGDLLVGTDCGGVWQIRPNREAASASDRWDNPDIGCLAAGSRSRQHAYAGCLSGVTGPVRDSTFLGEVISPALWETYESDSPWLAWRQIPLVDANGTTLNTGSIVRIAVVEQQQAIVLACGAGVFWSRIPRSGQGYSFAPVLGLQGVSSGIAVGPAGRVVVAAWGAKGDPRNGIVYAEWQANGLVVRNRAAISGKHLEPGMRRTALASCTTDPLRMYAVAAAEDDFLYAVLRSEDGGATWSECGTAVEGSGDHIDDRPPPGVNEETPGHLGSYTSALAASSTRKDLVAFALAAGPYISTNGGVSWQRHGPRDSQHLHADIHELHFDPYDHAGNRLVVGSDGGVAVTEDLGASWSSGGNENLATLECARGWASFSTGPLGVVAAGHQDNGNLWCRVNPQPGPWRELEGGDGQLDQFLPNGWLLRHNNTLIVNGKEFGNYARVAQWQPLAGAFGASAVVSVVGEADGLLGPNVSLTTIEGTWRTDKGNDAIVRGVGCPDQTNKLYLLLDGGGEGLRWQQVGELPNQFGNVTALASHDGSVIWVGTDAKRIFTFDPVTHGASEVQVILPANRSPSLIYSLVTLDVQTAFAIVAPSSPDTIVVHRKGTFQPCTDLPSGGRVWALHVHGAQLWAASDTRVYLSDDLGATWTDESAGLPVRPHCARLTPLYNAAGGAFIALSTYGRSMWKLRLGDHHDVSCGTSSLIQSDFPRGADHGNFEALLLEGKRLVHYWKDNKDVSSAWQRGRVVLKVSEGAASLIQGNLGEGDHGNFEAVILERGSYPDAYELWHWYRDHAQGDSPWVRGALITDRAVYAGCVIQSDFRSGERGNLEVLVTERDPISEVDELWHWFREGDTASSPWRRSLRRVSGRPAGPACFIQSDYPRGAEHKNFEALVLEQAPNGNLEVWHYFHDNSDVSLPWQPTWCLTDHAAGPATLIQSDFHYDHHGNLEALVPEIDSATGERVLQHFWCDAANPGGPWQRAKKPVIDRGAGAATLIQGDYRPGGEHGNFEALCHAALDVEHHSHDNTDVTLPWNSVQVVASDR